MQSSRPVFLSKVFREFKTIGEKEYQTIVRFFEEYEEDIRQLTFEEYFELLYAYTEALFEIGAYQSYLDVIDIFIELTISSNVKYYKGEDLFRKLLFKKAASQYNLFQYEKADFILRQLVKMNPADKLSVQFLKKCTRSHKPGITGNTRAMSVLIFIITAAVIGLELLVIQPLFAEHTNDVKLVRNGLFVFGWCILIGGEGVHRMLVSWHIDKYVASLHRR